MVDIDLVVLEIMDILENIENEGEVCVISDDGRRVTVKIERDKRPTLRIIRDDKG